MHGLRDRTRLGTASEPHSTFHHTDAVRNQKLIKVFSIRQDFKLVIYTPHRKKENDDDALVYRMVTGMGWLNEDGILIFAS